MDEIVLDLETKNLIPPDRDLSKLEISIVCIYSYQLDRYFCFKETELDKLRPFLQNSKLIGFAINRFDLPVLSRYINFSPKSSFDILEEIELDLGQRVSLGLLAEINLGIKKTENGILAVEYYRNGQLDELEKYCQKDVKLVKLLYNQLKDKGYLYVPGETNSEIVKWKYLL